MTDELFASFDYDGDGRITINEFDANLKDILEKLAMQIASAARSPIPEMLEPRLHTVARKAYEQST